MHKHLSTHMGTQEYYQHVYHKFITEVISLHSSLGSSIYSIILRICVCVRACMFYSVFLLLFFYEGSVVPRFRLFGWALLVSKMAWWVLNVKIRRILIVVVLKVGSANHSQGVRKIICHQLCSIIKKWKKYIIDRFVRIKNKKLCLWLVLKLQPFAYHHNISANWAIPRCGIHKVQ